ncbi:translesion error-prone DNA polymerase V subunit UmuC [Paramixta manurensis]|uniref:Translesion error-prone DNA polymerase V subunit UmuC n=1 Tax=Paramixta manurensis TaxID=2740817 RepID=A0A6M8UKY2_9GAMM|nr:translesion error-prone DNA polymerase V subunit UmuC [Erwiniaceae bacterium PD-1]
MYALVDVNTFYASCETVFRPDLKGRPVVVLSNNDGCVISLNREAKALGFRMASPWFKIRPQLQQHNVAVFSSNYALYADLSRRVMETLEEMAPRVENYSIDEAFLDLSGVANCMPLKTFGHQVRNRLQKEVHLSVGVGIAPTKTLAKLANLAAKRWPQQTGGVVELTSPRHQRQLLHYLPVEEVWGVGGRLAKKLNLMGITNALQLAEAPTALIRKHFSVVMERTARELRGEPCLAFDEFPPTKQHILCSRSFSERVTDYMAMREAVSTYAARAAEKLRREHQYCREINTFIRTSPHDSRGAWYSNGASYTLQIPTQDTRDITAAALRCLDAIWRPDHRYMKAGVILGDFFSQGVAQLHLFDAFQPRHNSEKLMKVCDDLNKKARNTLWFAGQGIQQEWAMKREMLSPAWTTRIADLPRVRIS